MASALWLKFEEIVSEISKERIRGASWCGRRAIDALQIFKGTRLSRNDIERIARSIESANPSIATLSTIAYVIRSIDPNKLGIVINRLAQYASQSLERVAKFAKDIVGRIVTTISYSSTVLKTIELSDHVEKVYLLESRPGSESLYFAKELMGVGVEVKLVPDSAMYIAVENSESVILGADAIDIKGNVMNKVGSKSLAIIANYRGRSVVVVSEAWKIHPHRLCSELEILTTRYRIGDRDVNVPLFEIVDHNLITVLVTDFGAVKPCETEVSRVLRMFRDHILRLD